MWVPEDASWHILRWYVLVLCKLGVWFSSECANVSLEEG